MLSFEEFNALRRRQEAAVEAELRARAAARQAHQHSDDEEDEEEDDNHHHHHLHQHSDAESDLSETDPLELLMKAKKAGYLLNTGGGQPTASPARPTPPRKQQTQPAGADATAAAGPLPTTTTLSKVAAPTAPAASEAVSPPTTTTATSMTAAKASFLERLGAGVETSEVQATMLCLVFLDLLATMALTVTDQDKDPWAGSSSAMVQVVRQNVIRLIESFSVLVVLVSVLEISMLFLAFRARFASHLGYVTDTLLLALFLVQQLHQQLWCRELRLLSVVRVWRAFRLVHTLLDTAREESAAVGRRLEEEKRVVADLRTEVGRLEDTIRRERDGKRRLNEMLQGYKDEVETLNEALKIAALDVALVAEESGSEDEEELLREHEHRPPNTIFVNEDGTYEIK